MKHSVKPSARPVSGSGTITSRSVSTKPTNSGSTASRSIASDKQGAGQGNQYSRSLSTKPSGDSGTVGRAVPLKTNSGVKSEPALRGATTHKTSKPGK